MSRNSLLLVDSDTKNRQVLEVSLKKAGFNVTTAENGRDALGKVETALPDLIISDTEMTEMSGFEFCAQLKKSPEWQDIPFIFLTNRSSIDAKIRGLELGVEDYLTRPIYIQELITRVRTLLEKRQRTAIRLGQGGETRFVGNLGVMGVVDLIQTIDVSRKTGIIHLRASRNRAATLFFRDGKVIDAECAHLTQSDAVYRLLTWNEGEFEVLFRPVRRHGAIVETTQALLMEGMRRLDEWTRLLEQLPSLEARFTVDEKELTNRLADLPDEVNQLLRLFDGTRMLLEIIDKATIGDLPCLEAISKLYFEGILVDAGPELNSNEEWSAQQTAPYAKLSRAEATRRAERNLRGKSESMDPPVESELQPNETEELVAVQEMEAVSPSKAPRRKKLSTAPFVPEPTRNKNKQRRPLAPTRPYADRDPFAMLGDDAEEASRPDSPAPSGPAPAAPQQQVIRPSQLTSSDAREAQTEFRRQKTPVLYPVPQGEEKPPESPRDTNQMPARAERPPAAAAPKPEHRPPATTLPPKGLQTQPQSITSTGRLATKRPTEEANAAIEGALAESPIVSIPVITPSKADMERMLAEGTHPTAQRPAEPKPVTRSENVIPRAAAPTPEIRPSLLTSPAAKEFLSQPTPVDPAQLLPALAPAPAPVVAPAQAPAPVVAPAQAPAPVVAPAQAPAPVPASVPVPAVVPVVAAAPPPAPVAAPAPAPVAAPAPAPAPAPIFPESPPRDDDYEPAVVVSGEFTAVDRPASQMRVPKPRPQPQPPPQRAPAPRAPERSVPARRRAPSTELVEFPVFRSSFRARMQTAAMIGLVIAVIGSLLFAIYVSRVTDKPAPEPTANPPPPAVKPTRRPARQPEREVAPEPPEPPEASGLAVQDRIDRATRLLGEGRLEQAARLLEGAAPQELGPALELRAQLRYHLQKRREALRDADAAVRIDSSMANAWFIKAMVHRDFQEDDAARAAFESYLALRPDARNAATVRRILSSL